MTFAIRATHKVLKRMGVRSTGHAAPPTTALGDWYVNLLYVGQTQLVLCTSEKSLLSVVLPAKRLKVELHQRLLTALEELLLKLHAPTWQVQRELEEMRTVTTTGTASRVVLGSMNDFAVLIDAAFRMRPPESFSALSLELARVPCGPLARGHGLGFPDRTARQLLGSVH